MGSNKGRDGAIGQTVSSENAPPSAETSTGADLVMIRLLMGVYWFDEALQSALKAAGWPPISRTQSLLFTNIAAGEHRPARLAANLGVSRQSMSQMLADLAARGYVRVEPDPRDRRAQIVTFGGQVGPLRAAASTVLRDLETELRARIGEEAFQALLMGLEAVWGDTPRVVAPPAG
jgi:DNA-binding MarR family transcriptional regulator